MKGITRALSGDNNDLCPCEAQTSRCFCQSFLSGPARIMSEIDITSTSSMHIAGIDNVTNHMMCLVPIKSLDIRGSRNQVRLDPSANLSDCAIMIRGSGNLIIVGKNTRLRGLIYVYGNKSLIRIGPETTTETVRFSVGGRASITIGRDCMLSRNIEIRCFDEHPIYDLDTKEEINNGQDVVLGDHVWIGEGVRVVKGTTIASGSIVGTGSLVSESLTIPNAIYAGIPARMIKQRIAWAREPRLMNWEKVNFLSE
ncbi:transferase family hexapeptide repeat protein [Rhizobium sp. PP-F2F-G48]|nr:transferase family hexapeptide repeat protein [Rhizobium sp. PP-F2F-G48]